MSVVLLGSTSGSVTLQEPAIAGSTVIDLPATSGTMAVLPTATSVLPEASGGTGTTTGYYGFKNRIINGACVIDQRNAGASFTVGNLGYGIDRWLTQAVTASGTGQQVAGSTGNNKALRITGASGNTAIQVSQRIESVNIYDCASQTVTVSFTLFGSASGSVSVRFLYPTATDNYTSTTEPVAGTSVSFTTTPTQYTVSRTLDSNANKGVWVLLDFGAVGASVTRTIEFFQLEKGSTATSFDYRPYGTELALCQRYYYKTKSTALVTSFSIGFVESTTVANGNMVFPVSLRTSPTAIEQSGTAGDYAIRYVLTDVTCSAVPYFVAANVDASWFRFPVASGLTAGQAVMLRALNTSAYLAWSAEL